MVEGFKELAERRNKTEILEAQTKQRGEAGKNGYWGYGLGHKIS